MREPGEPLRVFLNFNGGSLSSAVPDDDDATRDRSQLLSDTTQIDPADLSRFHALSGMATDEVKEAIRIQVAQFYTGINVDVVVNRPVTGAYTMAMLGGTTTQFRNGIDGISLVDCGNANPNNIAFVIINRQAPELEDPIQFFALLAAHEIGHSVGLDHTDNINSIMYGMGEGLPSQCGFTVGAPLSSAGCPHPTGVQDEPALLAENVGLPAGVGLPPRACDRP